MVLSDGDRTQHASIRSASYSHTTVEYAAPDSINVWGHERDKRDAEDGRDVDPLSGPVVDAILQQLIVADEWLSLTVHLTEDPKPLSETLTITVAES